jgi:hypothetical protein
MNIDLETLEDLRAEHVKNALVAMSSVLSDKKATIDQKIKACEVISVIDATMARLKIMTHEAEGMKGVDKTANKLIEQLGKLADQED